jgi:uncharacterized membrane protein AbrB (regulator of aidB expression)
MNTLKKNWWKWIFWTAIGVVMISVGLALRLKSMIKTWQSGIGMMLMTLGFLIVGFLLLYFVYKHLKYNSNT